MVGGTKGKDVDAQLGLSQKGVDALDGLLVTADKGQSSVDRQEAMRSDFAIAGRHVAQGCVPLW